MNKIKGTDIVIVSQEYWIKNKEEKQSAEKILKQKGNCSDIDCYKCPLYDLYSDCEENYDMRIEICSKMLRKE